jgi:hypothetical protein
MIIKEKLSKVVTKEPLPRKAVITETGKIITHVFDNYSKMVRIVSNGHLRQIVTERPSTFRVFSYLSTSIVHVPLAKFLCCYVVNIVKCSIPPLFFPLLHVLLFVFGPLFLSILVIMRGNVSKQKAKKMLRGQSSREAKPNFEQEITPNKVN